jgi:magnesium-transporting ATPase (P-type)
LINISFSHYVINRYTAILYKNIFLNIFQTLFEDRFIAVYNLFYTSQPVLALGIFDQDVDDKLSVKFPKLYTPGLTSSLFNKQEFFRSALQGFVTSCVLFFMNYGNI